MSTSDHTGFGTFVPGFEFMQQLARQASGGLMQGMTGHAPLPHLPNLSSWVTPTFNVEELDKRINELKAVHFWLEQNTRTLAATIQALEVQKMTLSTLQSMNVNFADVANTLKTQAADSLNSFANFTPSSSPSPASTAASAEPATPPRSTGKTEFAGLEIPPRRYFAADTPAPAEPAAPAESPPAPATEPAPESPPLPNLDPIQGWSALTQQFQTLAANAIKEVSPQTVTQTVLEAGKQMASTLTLEAMKTATDMTVGMARGLVPSVPTSDTADSPAPSTTDDTPPPVAKRRKTTKTASPSSKDEAPVVAAPASASGKKTSAAAPKKPARRS
jgi:hypothetical protein